MIETRIPIQIPPGLYMNGTAREQQGRWSDGNRVRFLGPEGHPRIIPGSQAVALSGAAISGAPMGAYAYYNENGGGYRIVLATSTKLFMIFWGSGGSSTITDITPSGGLNGTGGAGGQASGSFSFANLGDDLLIIRTGSGFDIQTSKMWRWNPNPGGLATIVTEFQTQYGDGRGVFVTPENFAVALQARTVAWASQGVYSTWIPSGTNTAGSLPIRSAGLAVRGAVVGTQSLIFTDRDLWQLEYVGGDLIFGLRSVGEACGILSPGSLGVAHGNAYWMGYNSFFQYDGYVRELQCDISDYVFGDIKRDSSGHFFVRQFPYFNEIHFHYISQSGGGTEPDRVAIYNYENKTWSKKSMLRAAGTHAALPGGGTFQNTLPGALSFHSTTCYVDPVESQVTDPVDVTVPFIQTPVAPLDDTENVYSVQKVLLDGAVTGDTVSILAQLERGGNILEMSAPISVAGDPSDVRFSARFVGYKHIFNSPTSRVGVPELGVMRAGKR